jgi:hypothetical protein
MNTCQGHNANLYVGSTMPDAQGNIKGIAIPATAWLRIFGNQPNQVDRPPLLAASDPSNARETSGPSST